MYFYQKEFVLSIENFKILFLEHLKKKVTFNQPKNLYKPIVYILNLGGKRLRPVLTLLSCSLFDGNITNALDAALAIEMFHNFSLVHDDIMDDAPKRRGKETVHKKWDVNTGILSGDAMLVLSNQLLESYNGASYKKLCHLFNKTALEVCEGQQYDVDFETRTDVTVDEYLTMISLKTAVLVATSLQFGAIIASATKNDMENIYQYGLNLGIAFQLQDDYLDVFGGNDFGKQKAGDIIENKKTFLYLKTLALAKQKDREKLLQLYGNKESNDSKVTQVIELFEKYKIPKNISKEIENYTNKANRNVSNLSISEDKKEVLRVFAEKLMTREV